jgi:hypothetical protein
MAPRQKNNYVDNEKFAVEMAKHHEKVLEAKARGESPRVPVNNYIGYNFKKIAEKLSLRPNFRDYSYRDEMVSDAIETMINNAHHFNPNAETRGGKPNPFSYFTLIAWRAFVHRINAEKKQEYTRMKSLEFQTVLGGGFENAEGKMDARYAPDLNVDYYVRLQEKFEKPPKEKTKKVGLDNFVED